MIRLYVGLLAIYTAWRFVFGDWPWPVAFANNFTPYFFLPLIVCLPFLARRPRWFAWTALLLAVGVGWAVPRTVTLQRASATSEDTLTVVSFNVWGNNPRTGDVIAWLRELDADLVLMQEIPPAWGENGIPALEDMYPHQIFRQDRPWDNGLLAAHPLTETEFENGFERHVIDWNGREVAVYNVHFFMPMRAEKRLDTPSVWLDMALRYDPRGRDAQINALIEKIAVEERPFIVGGDFNMSSYSTPYADLAAAMRPNVTGPTWPIARSAPFLPDRTPPALRIDYVWHSAAFTGISAETGPPLGSDHLPVVARLGIR